MPRDDSGPDEKEGKHGTPLTDNFERFMAENPLEQVVEKTNQVKEHKNPDV